MSDYELQCINLWLSTLLKSSKKLKNRRQKSELANSILQLKYQMIGIGSHRVVYDLQNGHVLKIVISHKGFRANEAEYNIFTNGPPEIQKHLCPVKELGQGWIIMKKMNSVIPMDEVNGEKLSQLKSKFLNYGIEPRDMKRRNLALSQKGDIIVIDYGNFIMKLE